MKAFSYLIVIFILLFNNSYLLKAQDKPFYQNNPTLSTIEKQGQTIQTGQNQAIANNNYDLKYHRFNWNIDPAQHYISGSVTSYFVATQDLMNSIQFQLNAGLTADSARYAGKTINIDHPGDLINIPLNPTVSLGQLDSLTVYYHGVPGLSGFGSFGNYVHNGSPSMWTLSEPYGASDWWPSKNDLSDKIDSIDVYVVMPKGNHAASNGILVSETPYDANSILAHWKHRYPIASYLIAIAVTNYARYSDYYKTGNDSIQVLNYVYPEDSLDLRARTADVLMSMALFEQLFGPYPFLKEKFGHAECNIGGGMEHQTMTFLGKNSFNHFIFTHELAHQWFGDMVTCGSWEDIWLNEGFAAYCLGLSYEFLPTDYTFKAYMNDIRDDILRQVQGSVFCSDTTNVSRIFNSALTYNKGAYLLHMLRWILGDSDFFQGLRNYLNDPALKYKFARTTDLKRQLENQSGKDLTRFFDDWFYGTGVPNYSIQVTQQLDSSTQVTINQSQYNSNVSFFNMAVPIEFKGDTKDTTLIFNHTYSGQTFDFKPNFRIDSVFFDPKFKVLYNQSSITLNQVTQFQNVNDNKIAISPNPANALLNVHHKSGFVNLIQILDLEGRSQIITTARQEDTLLVLNIQNLQPGMYILKVGTSGWLESKKFIVTK
ncbi:MAG: M1 family aminopeptidase [Paludibacter sp.]|nr:M1 family aminopeptidase [Paludibacter sp.]